MESIAAKPLTYHSGLKRLFGTIEAWVKLRMQPLNAVVITSLHTFAFK